MGCSSAADAREEALGSCREFHHLRLRRRGVHNPIYLGPFVGKRGMSTASVIDAFHHDRIEIVNESLPIFLDNAVRPTISVS